VDTDILLPSRGGSNPVLVRSTLGSLHARRKDKVQATMELGHRIPSGGVGWKTKIAPPTAPGAAGVRGGLLGLGR
jgi:hypothetical protein